MTWQLFGEPRPHRERAGFAETIASIEAWIGAVDAEPSMPRRRDEADHAVRQNAFERLARHRLESGVRTDAEYGRALSMLATPRRHVTIENGAGFTMLERADGSTRLCVGGDEATSDADCPRPRRSASTRPRRARRRARGAGPRHGGPPHPIARRARFQACTYTLV